MGFYPSQYPVLRVANGPDEIMGLGFRFLEIIATLDPPTSHCIPVKIKDWVIVTFHIEIRTQSNNSQEFDQVMLIAISGIFRREVMLPGSPGDAGLQGTFDCVTCKIVSTIVESDFKQGSRFLQS